MTPREHKTLGHHCDLHSRLHSIGAALMSGAAGARVGTRGDVR